MHQQEHNPDQSNNYEHSDISDLEIQKTKIDVRDICDVAPDLRDLQETFEFLSSSEYRGVKGVFKLDSGRQGPTIGITICTHGNEPSGLAPVWHMRNSEFLRDKLERGAIIFAINNLEAAQRGFDAHSFEERLSARQIDFNMNRMPEDALQRVNDMQSEMKRLRELRPIYAEFDIALDVHSTSTDSRPMILEIANMDWKLISGFPIQDVITNISVEQIGLPIGCFYGKVPGQAKVFEIESGHHERQESFQRTLECFYHLLRNCGLVSCFQDAQAIERNEYRTNGTIFFPDSSYELKKLYSDFEEIKRGQILATGNGPDILAPEDGHAMLAPHRLKPVFLAEEVLFLSAPVRKIK